MPGLMQACPTVAACWSPAMPSTGTGAPRMSAVATPNSAALSATVGSIDCGHAQDFLRARRPRRPCGCRAAGCGWRWSRRSHGPCRRSAATAGSSRSCPPPARPFRPRRARRRRSAGSRRSWCRRNRGRAAGRSSARRSSRGRRASARRTCPRCGGPARRWRCAPAWPFARSHTTVVSRWLVMPMPAMSLAVEPGVGESAAADLDGGAPDLLRVVLDPAGLGEDLRQFLLRRGHGLARAIEHDRARAGRALVDGEDVLGSHQAAIKAAASGRGRWRSPRPRAAPT